MKQFYFIGCSGTHCDDLTFEKRATHGWPALVSQHHQAQFVNDAVPGGTNDRIIRYVLKNLKKYDRYYIQWSWENRFTLYDADNLYPINFNNQLQHSLYNKKSYFSLFGKLYYTHWSVPIFEFKKWLEQVVLLQNTLEKHNCWYLMMTAHRGLWKKFVVSKDQFISNFSELHDIKNISDDQILEHYDDIQFLLSQINFKKLIDPNKFCANAPTFMFPVGPTNHPLEEGMIYTARTVLEFEKENYEN
jgi:hypothetical protein